MMFGPATLTTWETLQLGPMVISTAGLGSQFSPAADKLVVLSWNWEDWRSGLLQLLLELEAPGCVLQGPDGREQSQKA